ncbi:MAG: exosortase/archaeosortase family protein [Chloroflexi bacterium]|nr:exosortase/archaeosortase family protein [Chloroflexota bacterium]
MNSKSFRPIHARWRAFFFIAALFVFLPTWLWLFDAWQSDPYYSHGPLVVLVSLYFFWTRRRVIARTASEAKQDEAIPKLKVGDCFASARLAMTSNNFGFALLAIALALHLYAITWRAYYISALMIPLALLGLLVVLYGARVAKNFLFPLAFLVLMVPLPLAEQIGPVLEGWTASSATALAQMLGVPATNNGSQVFLANSTFTVGIPCGGLRSLIAIITLTTLFAYIMQGAAWARGAIFFAAIPIALAANTLRIALLFFVAQRWGADAGLTFFDS